MHPPISEPDLVTILKEADAAAARLRRRLRLPRVDLDDLRQDLLLDLIRRLPAFDGRRGSIGAFAGAFMTHVYMFVGMPVFALDYSILPIAAAVVGGPGTLAGATFGAFLLVPLSEALRGIGGLRIVLYGVFLVVFIVALPEGIFHYIQRKYHQVERWVEVE